MARIRSIKPEYPQDELLGKLSRDARLMYPLLWLLADDAGRFRANGALLKAGCFPYDDDLGIPEVRKILAELVTAGRVVEYEVHGQKYGYMPNFPKHQRIDHPTPSKIPPPSGESTEDVGGPREPLAKDSRGLANISAGIGIGSGVDGKGIDQDGRGPGRGADAASSSGPRSPASAAGSRGRPDPDTQPPEYAAYVNANRAALKALGGGA